MNTCGICRGLITDADVVLSFTSGVYHMTCYCYLTSQRNAQLAALDSGPKCPSCGRVLNYSALVWDKNEAAIRATAYCSRLCASAHRIATSQPLIRAHAKPNVLVRMASQGSADDVLFGIITDVLPAGVVIGFENNTSSGVSWERIEAHNPLIEVVQ